MLVPLGHKGLVPLLPFKQLHDNVKQPQLCGEENKPYKLAPFVCQHSRLGLFGKAGRRRCPSYPAKLTVFTKLIKVCLLLQRLAGEGL